MIKITIKIIISILVVHGIFTTFPRIWKFFGGTFMWGNAVVYKGKLLFEHTEHCSAVNINNFKEVRQVCPSKDGPTTRVWIDGVEKLNSIQESVK